MRRGHHHGPSRDHGWGGGALHRAHREGPPQAALGAHGHQEPRPRDQVQVAAGAAPGEAAAARRGGAPATSSLSVEGAEPVASAHQQGLVGGGLGLGVAGTDAGLPLEAALGAQPDEGLAFAGAQHAASAQRQGPTGVAPPHRGSPLPAPPGIELGDPAIPVGDEDRAALVHGRGMVARLSNLGGLLRAEAAIEPLDLPATTQGDHPPQGIQHRRRHQPPIQHVPSADAPRARVLQDLGALPAGAAGHQEGVHRAADRPPVELVVEADPYDATARSATQASAELVLQRVLLEGQAGGVAHGAGGVAASTDHPAKGRDEGHSAEEDHGGGSQPGASLVVARYAVPDRQDRPEIAAAVADAPGVGGGSSHARSIGAVACSRQPRGGAASRPQYRRRGLLASTTGRRCPRVPAASRPFRDGRPRFLWAAAGNSIKGGPPCRGTLFSGALLKKSFI